MRLLFFIITMTMLHFMSRDRFCHPLICITRYFFWAIGKELVLDSALVSLFHLHDSRFKTWLPFHVPCRRGFLSISVYLFLCMFCFVLFLCLCCLLVCFNRKHQALILIMLSSDCRALLPGHTGICLQSFLGEYLWL